MRDYLDSVVLFERLGEEGVPPALAPMDELYPQKSGASVLVEVGERLAEAAPADAPEMELSSYRGLRAPWNEWAFLRARGCHWAQVVARLALEGGPEETQ
jgi:hypothetical protein